MTARRPAAAPRSPMCDAQHAATTAELTRLTLGGRPHRPELETTIAEPVRRRPTRKKRR